MLRRLSFVLLRFGLDVLRALQPRLSGRADDALRRAAALKLTADEKRAEAAVDALRQRLSKDGAVLTVQDHGAGADRPAERQVCDIYKQAATGPAWGRFLFGLVRGYRPTKVLELGTNLGVGAAHLAQALCLNGEDGHPGRLVTLEGAPELAARAAGHLARLGHPVGDDDCRVRVVIGPFAETLPGVAREEGPFDLVFVDGHHEAEAALGYLDVLRPHLADGALVVLDDVEPGRPVRRAWTALKPGGESFYAVKYGLLVHELGGAPAPPARETGPPPTDATAA